MRWKDPAPVPGTYVVITEISLEDYDPEHVVGEVAYVFRNAGRTQIPRGDPRYAALIKYWYLPKDPHGHDGRGHGGSYVKFRPATPEEEAAWRLAGARARVRKDDPSD